MTKDVAAVRVRTPYKEVVRVLDERGVSSLPVLDDEGQLVGVVSEADILGETPGARPRGLLRHGGSAARRARERAKRLSAQGVMSAPAVTVRDDDSIAAAARTLLGRELKAAPVVDDHGALVGIVARRDLLRRYLRSDSEIREEVQREVFMRVLWADPERFEIDVHDGIVVLKGTLEQRSAIPVAVHLTQAVDGVVDVIDQLGYEVDDTHTRPAFRMPR
ncbi:CBS domain-containing protein [Streptomyces sp. ICBB 8177]|uniref:CBS domain-containing protein n=1 Tax=Streptomyces sp. ICBB 8177 TaxID=563922 RepID=UPI000D6793E2|nr:CBS domain-containing protein [Streptomyces sp. ICBB 8177]PWI44729.1 hypothetical protein CK485_05785 [Streptomyces sp. ICBB 8177]